MSVLMAELKMLQARAKAGDCAAIRVLCKGSEHRAPPAWIAEAARCRDRAA
jgi:hypothetical protein